ncbi:MAG: tail-specific protease [Bacteroidetes bacterium]|nr:MAG: tail-specific protease [Bacteroidota bacterium]
MQVVGIVLKPPQITGFVEKVRVARHKVHILALLTLVHKRLWFPVQLLSRIFVNDQTTFPLMMYATRPSDPLKTVQKSIDMKWKPSLLFFSFLGIAGLVFFFNRLAPFQGDDPNPKKEAKLIQSILYGLERFHYAPKEVNDQFSREAYNLYLENVDGGKRFFTQSDIDQLQPFATELDDEARAGTYAFFNLSIDLLGNSVDKVQGWYREILSKPMDFNVNEYLETDGKKLSWAQDDAELQHRWEHWMKYEVLSRITDELENQEKPEFKGEKKDFATLETEIREKVLEIYDRRFKPLQKRDRSRQLEVYLNSLINIFDPHSGYFSPKNKAEFDFRMSGKLEGIGARLQSDGEKTTVTEIVPGGPAWKQGDLKSKDVIVKVAQGDDEPVDVMGWEIDDVVSKIRGPKGTIVKLTVQKPEGSTKVISIVRDIVITEEAMAKSLILSTEGAPDKVGYIYLPKFYADFTPEGITSCAEDVEKEIAKLRRENVNGIILDLRNNGGGSLRDVVRMSGLFIEQGPIVQVKSRGRQPDINADSDPRVQYNGPLIVMVNAGSASASEIMAAAMQDYGRAVIVGASTQTYGKGTVQRFWDLDLTTNDESIKPMGEMKVTIQKFYRITGKTNQLEGVIPDIVLPDSYMYIDYGEREDEYPMPATTIEPVAFNQNAYHIANLDKLAENSATRVKQNATFKLIEENAQRLKRQRDVSQFPLEKEAFQAWDKSLVEEAKPFENMLQPIGDFKIENPMADRSYIQSDTSRVARNDDWLKDRKKDIQLYETLRIMQDMIRMDAVAATRERNE